MKDRGRRQRHRMLAVYGAVALASFVGGLALSVLALWLLVTFG